MNVERSRVRNYALSSSAKPLVAIGVARIFKLEACCAMPSSLLSRNEDFAHESRRGQFSREHCVRYVRYIGSRSIEFYT